MRVLMVNGWLQREAALRCLFTDAELFDARQPVPICDVDIAIGFSLGGVRLVDAILAKRVRCRWLVLIGTPFRFLGADGMDPVKFAQMRGWMSDRPRYAAAKLDQFIHHGNNAPAQITGTTDLLPDPAEWLEATERLANADFSSVDMAAMPPTLILHGRQDLLVPVAQVERWWAALPDTEIVIYDGCGHAPQLCDPDAVRERIVRFAHV